MKSIILKLIFLTSSLILIQSCGQNTEEDCARFSAKIVQTGSDQLTAEVPLGAGSFLYSYKWSNGLGDFSSITVSESGVYSVTVTDLETGCTDKSSYEFTKSLGNGCGTFTAVTDAENNLYDIVTIGTQCWMKSNLSIEAGIPNIKDETAWAAATSPAWCYYKNDVNYGPKYGKLYNWYAVNSGKLCPQGWRISSKVDWEILIKHFGNDSLASIALKKIDPLWMGNLQATNESGFSALPAGRRNPGGDFSSEGNELNFWAIDDNGFGLAISLYSQFYDIAKLGRHQNFGFSCRCIKN